MRLPIRRKSTIVRVADHYFRLGAEQARRVEQAYVGSEHVLLGLARTRESTAAVVLERVGVTAERIEAEVRRDPGTPPPTAIDPHALATLGIELKEVREQVDGRFGAGALERTRRGCWPVEPSLKRALAHAVEEADGEIPCDAQILGGLVAVSQSGAARVLHRLGVNDDTLRRALREG